MNEIVNNINTMETLDEPTTKNHPDGLVRTYGLVHGLINKPYPVNGKYFSVPLAKGFHIGDDPRQNYSLEVFKAVIFLLATIGKGGSILIKADPGFGKTYWMIEDLSTFLGELLNTEVYATMPYRNLVVQQNSAHGCDIRYGQAEIEEPGQSPNMRVYIYDHADKIPTRTDKELSGVSNPIVFMIDEAHTLMSEAAFRDPALRKVTEKARKIREEGGIVIAVTASTDCIAANIPYNDDEGYDVIVNFFGVSSDDPLITENGEIPYPQYNYRDLVKYGEQSGVSFRSAIPVNNVRIMYMREKENAATALLSVIKDLTRDDKNRLTLSEYNNKGDLAKIEAQLASNGYKVEVCQADDKGFETDPATNKRTYKNQTLGSIIETGMINTSYATTILVTKLLEGGTTINGIIKEDAGQEELQRAMEDTVCIYVIPKLDQYDTEVFEQFLSRIRYDHNDAIIIMPEPKDESVNKMVPDLEFYIIKEFTAVKKLLDDLKEGRITRERLAYIDMTGKEGLAMDGNFDAETTTKTLMSAIKKYYKYLMHHKSVFEGMIRERYADKNVTFERTPVSEDTIARKHPPMTKEQCDIMSAAIDQIYHTPDIRDAYSRGGSTYTEDGKNRALPGPDAFKKCLRPDYNEPFAESMGITLTLQSLQRNASKDSLFKESVPEVDLPDRLRTESSFSTALLDAVSSQNKKDINRLRAESVSVGFGYLKKFPRMFDIIYRYAIRRNDRSSDNTVENLVEDCVSVLPRLSSEDMALIRNLLQHLFTSEVKKPIDRMIYTCSDIRPMDMGFYADMANHTLSEIEDITLAHEVTSFILYPERIHEDKTPSGATFAAMTSARAFKVATGLDMDPDRGLESWVDKSISRGTAMAIHAEYMKIFEEEYPNMPVVRSVSSGALKVLRLFAAAFSMSPKLIKDGKEKSYKIRAIRTEVPKNYEAIIKYTFKAKTPNR